MRDSSRTTSREAGGLPSLVEGSNRSWILFSASLLCDHPKEHPGFNFPRLSQTNVLCVLSVKQASKIVCERKDPPFSILRRARVKPHLARFEVNVTPLEGKNLRRD